MVYFHKYLKTKSICDVIFPPGHYCSFNSIPKKSTYFNIGLISKDLLPEEKDLFEIMNSNYRNEIRKLMKEKSLKILYGNDGISNFYELYKNTHLRQKLLYDSFEHFRNLITLFPENSLVVTLYVNENCLSSILIIYDNKTAYYFYAGNENNTAYPGANKLILFETFIELKKRNINSIILGGFRSTKTKSKKQEGIQNFKLRFGTNIDFGIHFIHVINPYKYFFFNLALKIKSLILRKNLSLINLSGLEVKKS